MGWDLLSEATALPLPSWGRALESSCPHSRCSASRWHWAGSRQLLHPSPGSAGFLPKRRRAQLSPLPSVQGFRNAASYWLWELWVWTSCMAAALSPLSFPQPQPKWSPVLAAALGWGPFVVAHVRNLPALQEPLGLFARCLPIIFRFML